MLLSIYHNLSRIITVAIVAIALFLSGCVSSDEGEVTNSAPTEIDTQQRELANFCRTQELGQGALAEISSLFTDFLFSRSLERDEGELAERLIPVYFHIISGDADNAAGEVPDAVLVEQIDVLNRAYSGELGGVQTPFRFRLAGIDRTQNEQWSVFSPGSNAEFEAKEALRIGGTDTLNVYIVEIEFEDALDEDVAGIVLGYSTLPFIAGVLPQYDGIALNYRAVPGGPLEHYNLGHTLVHEVGHWLGLMHTFQGECDGLFDDLVADTPRERTPQQGDYCPLDRDSCESRTGSDPVHNHMTYTGDSCRYEFTKGQIDFMIFNTETFRGITPN